MLVERVERVKTILSRLFDKTLPNPSSRTLPGTLRIMSAIQGSKGHTVEENRWKALGEALAGSMARQKSHPDSAEHILLPHFAKMDQVLCMRKNLSDTKARNGRWSMAGLKRVLSWIQSPPGLSARTMGKRICIVGIHGWFPTKMLQKVVGVPRGTSTRLCSMMKEALTEFLNEQPCEYLEGPKPHIHTVPLEGDGCIEERVARHYAQLDEPRNDLGQDATTAKTARDLIREADCVILVAHSQGAPVTALLVERLIQDSVLRPERDQNVGILTLAGVFHGPFPLLAENLVVKWVEADAARELFDLNDPHSSLSVAIQRSLGFILENDVVMVNVASWMDQVVPLHSAALLGVDHPHIWRSVYIDAHNYQPDFLSHLVDLALTLTNGRIAGGRQLLAQLGLALTGSIYQSTAHSTLYRELKVYQSLLHWMSVCDRPQSRTDLLSPQFHPSEMHPGQGSNPYELPWIMRGLLSDKTLLANPLVSTDIEKLRELHVEWDPARKSWKELKLQLQPLASKL